MLDESRDILRNYAEATGQSSAKIDAANYADPYWRGNQFSNSYSGGGSIAPRSPEVYVPRGGSGFGATGRRVIRSASKSY